MPQVLRIGLLGDSKLQQLSTPRFSIGGRKVLKVRVPGHSRTNEDRTSTGTCAKAARNQLALRLLLFPQAPTKLMIDEFAVKLAVEYLDRNFAHGTPADLVGMLDHVDYYDRVVMVLEEVQEVLKQRPCVYVQRVDGRVIFIQSCGDREITEEDFERNVQIKTEEFWAKYRHLESREEGAGE